MTERLHRVRFRADSDYEETRDRRTATAAFGDFNQRERGACPRQERQRTGAAAVRSFFGATYMPAEYPHIGHSASFGDDMIGRTHLMYRTQVDTTAGGRGSYWELTCWI